MSEELKRLIRHMENFKFLHKDHIPDLIKEIKKLEDSEKLAWAMVDKLENEMGAYR